MRENMADGPKDVVGVTNGTGNGRNGVPDVTNGDYGVAPDAASARDHSRSRDLWEAKWNLNYWHLLQGQCRQGAGKAVLQGEPYEDQQQARYPVHPFLDGLRHLRCGRWEHETPAQQWCGLLRHH